MALLVQKYGGTSVGSAEKIRDIAQSLAFLRHKGHQLVVVVSAMGDTTDHLIDLANQTWRSNGQPPEREMDMLLSVGERISMALLSIALQDLGIPAISFTGSQVGIITEGLHRRARIKYIIGDRLKNELSLGKVVIVAGFQGVSEAKEITTLGRGGSDTTAVALAQFLRADQCDILTDVDGVYSADPSFVKNARLLSNLSFDEMIEMAYAGAKVLHPRSVDLAKRFAVPIRVARSLSNNMGSKIGFTSDKMETHSFKSVAVAKDKCLAVLKLKRPSLFSSVWEKCADLGFETHAPAFVKNEVRFFLDLESKSEWQICFESLLDQEFLESYQIQEDVSPLTLVGAGFSQDGKALNEVLKALGDLEILIETGAISPVSMILSVPVLQADECVKILHSKLIQ
jgi:aspartate kinase